jgi:hypothetical protein
VTPGIVLGVLSMIALAPHSMLKIVRCRLSTSTSLFCIVRFGGRRSELLYSCSRFGLVAFTVELDSEF